MPTKMSKLHKMPDDSFGLWGVPYSVLFKSLLLIPLTFTLGLVIYYLNMMLLMSPMDIKNQVALRLGFPMGNSHVRHCVLAPKDDIYMYSAFVNLPRQTYPEKLHNDTDIVITTLDKSQASISCCVLYNDKKSLHVTAANIHYEHVKKGSLATLYVARQYICRLPLTQDSLRDSYMTLSSANCSTDIADYLPIQKPTRIPGGLALCAKIAHSDGLDPEKVTEWFEVQRLLGVDQILIFDLGHPENLNPVFKYYQKLGILNLQPYELPGDQRNRTLQERWKKTAQFGEDETMAVLECRQRMAGFDYIISHDVDEFIIPRMNVTLKEFLGEQLQQQPKAAGLYFHTQSFLTAWEPTNPEEDLMVKRYRRTTEPRMGRYPQVYLPSRVNTSMTLEFFPESRLPPTAAILHQYRPGPEGSWSTGNVSTIIDDVMARYRDLDERVAKVRAATAAKPYNTPRDIWTDM